MCLSPLNTGSLYGTALACAELVYNIMCLQACTPYERYGKYNVDTVLRTTFEKGDKWVGTFWVFSVFQIFFLVSRVESAFLLMKFGVVLAMQRCLREWESWWTSVSWFALVSVHYEIIMLRKLERHNYVFHTAVRDAMWAGLFFFVSYDILGWINFTISQMVDFFVWCVY